MTAWEGLTPPYATIVADPPWDNLSRSGTTRRFRNGRWQEPRDGLPYSTMPLAEIRDLPVVDLAGERSHLYLWTTNLFLEASFAVARAWGFDPIKPVVWCKPPGPPFMGGAFGGLSVEFCLVATRGRLPYRGAVGRQWFEWPRGPHSVKPTGFLDLVERVSPGPYVELFARAPRLGWDSWGYGFEDVAS